MELIGFLRILAAHRRAVGAGLASAVLAAVSMVYQVSLVPPNLSSPKRQVVGFAWTSMLLATPSQPAFDLTASKISETLPARATLLAAALTTDARRHAVASAARVGPEQIAIVDPAISAPVLAVPLAVSASAAARPI